MTAALRGRDPVTRSAVIVCGTARRFLHELMGSKS